MTTQEVVHLTESDCETLAAQLSGAHNARLMIDDGGIKVSANSAVWSWPPVGEIHE